MSAALKHRHSRTKRRSDDDHSSSVIDKPKQNGWRRIILCIILWKKCISIIIFVMIYLIGGKIWPEKPTFPIINEDIDMLRGNDWPLIHIVQSRFMQEQGPLETLGMARLKLFQVFCLPSMIQQSSQDFFWIIKTDPKFTKTAVFDSLVRLVRPHDNIYVVASNKNFVFGTKENGSWRDGKEGLDLLQSKIYTGNIERLHVANALRNEKVVLETRLDADDGLHEKYIEYVQDIALKRFQPFDRSTDSDDTMIPDWLYWCSRRHIEWHSETDGLLPEEQNANLGSTEHGYMNIIQHDKLCVTPGITVGYNINVDNSKRAINVPHYDHDKLYKSVRNSKSCYYNEAIDDNDKTESDDEATARGPCLELIEDFLFCAIRSRTWTSAGMQGVSLAARDGRYQEKEVTQKLWALAAKSFGVTKSEVKKMQQFLIQNKKRIAQENLIGQCSSGHSCKDSAKEELRKIIALESKE